MTLYNLIKNGQRLQSRREIPLEEAAGLPDRERESTLGELLPMRLHDREREILIWRFEQQMSYREMSVRLGVSETVCRIRVSQAVSKCRKLLQEH